MDNGDLGNNECKIKVPCIFSSGALFQSGSVLTVRGMCAADTEVTAALYKEDSSKKDRGNAVFTGRGKADGEGNFTVEIGTPKASFETYTLVIKTKEDEVRAENVMFGELFLASGQSNMELPNSEIPENNVVLEELKGRNIRFYHVDYQGLLKFEDEFPYEPMYYGAGWWFNAEQSDKLTVVSALATAFARRIYDFLNEKEENTPVGILNATWGGTSLAAWIAREDIEKNEEISAFLKEHGWYPDRDNWNKMQEKGYQNFQQPSAQFNVKIAPVLGAKVRGIIWYQGENECSGNFFLKSYARMFKYYRETYVDKFAADPEKFMVISSLILPWTYGESGECSLGYLNDAFVETAKDNPDGFTYATTGDLEPSWAFHRLNHPIHPTHKYILGDRMAGLAIANIYGGPGQKRPATFKAFKARGNRGVVTFDLPANREEMGLIIVPNAEYVPAEGILGEAGYDVPFVPVHGMYASGKSGSYLPVTGRVIARNKLEICCEGVKSIKNIAFNCISMEPCVNLFSGDLPVAPFHTDNENYLNIQYRPWYDMACISTWGSRIHGEVLDMFYRPVWHPLNVQSEVCPDGAFIWSDSVSLRVGFDGTPGENGSEFGCYVKSYPYQELDLVKYSGLSLNLFNSSDASPSLVLTFEDGSELKLPLKVRKELSAGWSEYFVSFSRIRSKLFGKISRMALVLRTPPEKKEFIFVNAEHIRLFE